MRTVEFGLLATKKFSVPGPVPGLPEVTLIQVTLVVADHGQAAAVEILALPLNPPVVAVILPRVTPYEQDVPAWDTVKARPAMVIFPVRDALEFAATA